MNAIVFDKRNKLHRLSYREVDLPKLSAARVLVKVKAVSLNAADYRSIRLGIVPNGRILGSDVAGEVVAVFKDVQKFSIGDRVVGDLSGCGFGGLAEFAAAPENVLAKIPSSLSDETAAGLPMAAVTALQALVNEGGVQAGQHVLIVGAGGGVGQFSVQLAKLFGANVTAVCGPRNIERIAALGADTVIDYTKEAVAKSGRTYDLVIAINGNRSLSFYRSVMASTGRCVLVGGSLKPLITFMLLRPFLSFGKKQMRLLSAKPSTTDLEFVLKLVEEGKLRVIVDRSYALPDTPQAIEYLSQGHAGGKVIIIVDPAKTVSP